MGAYSQPTKSAKDRDYTNNPSSSPLSQWSRTPSVFLGSNTYAMFTFPAEGNYPSQIDIVEDHILSMSNDYPIQFDITEEHRLVVRNDNPTQLTHTAPNDMNTYPYSSASYITIPRHWSSYSTISTTGPNNQDPLTRWESESTSEGPYHTIDAIIPASTPQWNDQSSRKLFSSSAATCGIVVGVVNGESRTKHRRDGRC